MNKSSKLLFSIDEADMAEVYDRPGGGRRCPQFRIDGDHRRNDDGLPPSY